MENIIEKLEILTFLFVILGLGENTNMFIINL